MKFNKTGFTIGLLIILLALSLGTSVLVVGSRSNDAAGKAAQAELIALRTRGLLKERIALRVTKDEIIQNAFERSCEDTNKRFGKLLPLERSAKQQILHSALYAGHEAERTKSLALVNQAIDALQPTDCTYHIVQPPKH